MESLLDEVADLFVVITRVYNLKCQNIKSFETHGFEDKNSIHNWFHKDDLDLTVPANFRIVCDSIVEECGISMIAFSDRLAVFETFGITYTLTFIEISNGFRVCVDLIPIGELNETLLCVFLQYLVELMPLIRTFLYCD